MCSFKAFSLTLLLLYTLHWGRGCTKCGEGAQPGQLTQTDQKDILWQIMCCAWQWKLREGLWRGHLLLKDCLGTGLLVGGGKWLPSHHLICFTSSSFFLFSAETWPMSSFLLLFLFYPTCHWAVGGEWAAVWCLAASQGTAVLQEWILKALKFDWKAAITKPKEKKASKRLARSLHL